MTIKTHIKARTFRAIFLILAASFLSSALYSLYPLITGWKNQPLIIPESISDILFIAILSAHLLWAALLAAGWSSPGSIALKIPAGMFAFTLLFFLFSWLYAMNAGLEYVQRYAESSDVLSFAPDTFTGKIYSLLLYIPFLLSDISAIFVLKTGKGVPPSFTRLALSLLSAVLYSLSFPSLLGSSGLGPFAFVALVPMIIVIHCSKPRQGIFWASVSGVFQITLINYWLSTFSLVSLQAVIIIYVIHYSVFMTILVAVYKTSGRLGWIAFPLAWVTLEYFRARGFAAYPWCVLGSSQYRFTSFLQLASVTGVYGLSFLAALVNSAISHAIISLQATSGRRAVLRSLFPVAIAVSISALSVIWGSSEIRSLEKEKPEKTVGIALIQQNTDPRKSEYRDNFLVLKKLTEAALAETGGNTDLIAWSETAYVPNIRRWGAMERASHPLAALTGEFLDFQKEKGIYLLTGNDDYELLEKPGGNIERKSYNAAVLFSGTGKREGTYRKIKLVPFTEYFPFEKQLPGLYSLLLKMDVSLWEPGTEYTVFRHPEFSFSTPICFEDIFPDHVRRFVRSGAQVILNISNDYWSLTEDEGMQHFISGMIRSVENRRPVLRATASGLTGVVERTGKIRDMQPFYKPLYVNTEIALYGTEKETFYTRFGDWFPLLCLFSVIFILLAGIFRIISKLPRKGSRTIKISLI